VTDGEDKRSFKISIGEKIMSNIISLHKNDNDKCKWLSMSNSYTSVVILTIALSGSALAEYEWQKELVIWFAEHDQSVIGEGVVGFDIDDIPWTPDKFDEEKSFLLNVIDEAINKQRWEQLWFEPGEHIFEFLSTFRELINSFHSDWIIEHGNKQWKDGHCEPEDYIIPTGFPKCKKHDVLEYWGGCVICNHMREYGVI
jgi:hypothetical protein